MAQPATNAKIEELRFKVKNDPKSRLFYPLAEELRKAGQVTEAEQVLRTGLTAHGSYLSAWVSLGRVLRDQKKDGEAVDALSKALQLDPGNVVAARLLADAYLALGDKVEAIKKYKLVYALLPSDEELKEHIDALDRELNPPAPAPLAAAPPAPEEAPWAEPEAPEPVAALQTSPFGDDTASDRPMPTMEAPFEDAFAPAGEEARRAEATGDAEPMLAAHEESPFEEPAAGYSVSALTVEGPAGFHVDSPLSAEVAAPLFADEEPPAAGVAAAPSDVTSDESDVFAPAEPVAHPPDDLASTLTMADLYARQGLTADARQIYQSILARDPDNTAVAAKLAELDRASAPEPVPAPEASSEPVSSDRVRKLEDWLSRVSRREVGRV